MYDQRNPTSCVSKMKCVYEPICRDSAESFRIAAASVVRESDLKSLQAYIPAASDLAPVARYYIVFYAKLDDASPKCVGSDHVKL